MTHEAFELAVIDIASQGIKITVANVAAKVRLAPAHVEEMLDRMASEGRLDMELDEERGLIFYVVRGLTPPPTNIVRYPGSYVPPSYAASSPVGAPRRGNKSPTIGAVLGFLVPGVGLLYAAPWVAAAVFTFATFVMVKMVGALPLIGWLLKSAMLGLAALTSGVLGAIYVRKYNANGKRTHLDMGATRNAGRSLVTPLREAERVALG